VILIDEVLLFPFISSTVVQFLLNVSFSPPKGANKEGYKPTFRKSIATTLLYKLKTSIDETLEVY